MNNIIRNKVEKSIIDDGSIPNLSHNFQIITGVEKINFAEKKCFSQKDEDIQSESLIQGQNNHCFNNCCFRRLIFENNLCRSIENFRKNFDEKSNVYEGMDTRPDKKILHKTKSEMRRIYSTETTDRQKKILRKNFNHSKKLTENLIIDLSRETELSPDYIKKWWYTQNKKISRKLLFHD